METIQDWLNAGFTIEDKILWQDANYLLCRANDWVKAGYSFADAQHYRSLGLEVTDVINRRDDEQD